MERKVIVKIGEKEFTVKPEEITSGNEARKVSAIGTAVVTNKSLERAKI
ncbi:hypothetical protein [Shouchella clausii]|nr:hypothetical protein [Shouchella clausii]